mgnify:CR=1 FL=1
MSKNITLRSAIKKNIDRILHPIGLTIERFFGENLELKKIIKTANKLDINLLLDIGANRGQYAESIIASGFNKKIISFEPLPEAHEILQEKSNLYPSWEIYEKCAIGNYDGFSEINIADNEYSSSLLNVNDKHLSIAPEAASKKSEKVKIITLDSISDNIYGENIFLKIDTQGFEDKVLYFPKSYVSLVRKLNGKNSDENKDVFIAKMKNHLLNHPKKKFAYDNTESNSEKLDGELAKEWNHYLNGIYGICTLNATPEEIVEKEVAVKRLIHFIDSTKQNDWRPKQSELKEIVAAFDQVSSRFAPYQRESSSRGKYVDKSLQKLGVEDKIKGY